MNTLVLLLLAAQMLQMGETSEGFVSLYTGRDLGQWEGDPRFWSVVDTRLTGSSRGALSHLIYRGRPYQDFELRFDVRVSTGSAGILFRATAGPNGTAQGPRVNLPPRDSAWTEYTIRCQGPKIRITVDGKVAEERSAETPRRGVLALELPAGPAAKVEFRNIRLKEL